MLIGVISDTHAYLDPRVPPVFEGVDAILHAGDVCSSAVLDGLRAMAPLHAVQGNNDAPLGGLGLPERLDLVLDGLTVHLVHELPRAKPLPDTRCVVFGHSHKALAERRDGVLHLNPGAAGRAGFHKLQTVALLRIEDGTVAAEIVELGPREKLPPRQRAVESRGVPDSTR